MKIIVAGGRDIIDLQIVYDAWNATLLEWNFPDGTYKIVSGMARGVDSLACEFAALEGYELKSFPANWDKYNKAAGPIRNKQMADYSDALIAIWDGESRGTKNMIDQMEKMGKPVYVYRI